MWNELIKRRPELAVCEASVKEAFEIIKNCYQRGGKLILCGNGGSAADCDHIVGELMKDFLIRRPLSEKQREDMSKRVPTIDEEMLDTLQLGLPAISLPSITGFNTAFCNDRNPELLYAQGVLALAKENDVLIAISTSGNAKNVYHAAEVARGIGVAVVGLTGETGGALLPLCSACVCVPERETYKIQELHIAVYHYLCAAIEKHFFG